MLIVCEVIGRLFAMANELWKTSLTSSIEKTDGSELSKVQLMTIGPPEVGFEGISSVRAVAKGAMMASATTLIFLNMSVVVKVVLPSYREGY